MRNMKEIFLKEEGNAYFRRNDKGALHDGKCAVPSFLLLEDFLSRNFNRKDKVREGGISKCLEIGCSSGYNLIHLFEKFQIEGYGIEPSQEAIEYGKKRVSEVKYPIHLTQGTSDDLPYEDSLFDIVVLGFCLFWVDRHYLFKTISEVDRVLKDEGILLINDFDTGIPYKRKNHHNVEAFTYKMDYSSLFLANPQYYLLEKYSYSHESNLIFHKEIQERVSTIIIYKENIEDAYMNE